MVSDSDPLLDDPALDEVSDAWKKLRETLQKAEESGVKVHIDFRLSNTEGPALVRGPIRALDIVDLGLSFSRSF